MSATVTFEYDDGSEIVFFDIPDHVTDGIVDNYLYNFSTSIKV
jgi:hypothetical protein